MKRFEHIDSMRGIAAIGVIYFHVADQVLQRHLVQFYPEFIIFSFFTGWVDLGKVAVGLFFIISGFVIPFSLFKNTSYPIRSFILSRIFRLYPAYWVSIPFGIIFFYLLPGNKITSSVVVLNVTMLQQFFGTENIIGLYWTLQIELIFYFLCVVMFFKGILKKPNIISLMVFFCLLGALALGIGRHITGRNLPVALPLALSLMYTGLLVRLTSLETDIKAKLRLNVNIFALIILIPIICFFGYSNLWPRYALTYYVAIGLFFLFAFKVKITTPIFVYFGRISYSLYLFGPIGQAVAMLLLVGYLNVIPIHVVFILSFVIAAVISIIVYHRVEAPSIAAGRNLAHWLDQTKDLKPRGA